MNIRHKPPLLSFRRRKLLINFRNSTQILHLKVTQIAEINVITKDALDKMEGKFIVNLNVTFVIQTICNYKHDDCGYDSSRGEHLLELAYRSHQEERATYAAYVAECIQDGEENEAAYTEPEEERGHERDHPADDEHDGEAFDARRPTQRGILP